MKNVIVIYYTQSGQLEKIAQNIAKPLLNDQEISVTFYNIEMEKPFPFPWPKADFFDAFPESFLQIPAPIHSPSQDLLNKKYDLVILAYQVWYLTPSIPINSFLKSDFGQQIIKDTPVVTVIGARNMWIMAQEKMKKSLIEANAKLVGNIALVDRHINHISVITIVHWMFTGKQTNYLGIFPKPGVADEEISNSSKFGEIILKYLKSNHFESLQNELVANDAVEIRPFLIEMDKKANKMFTKWANLIVKKNSSRQTWLKFFNIYLFVAIWIISPIVYILHLFSIPFKTNQIKKEKTYYKQV
ncbi:dialkylresorcinol condensing enzyme DarA [Flavobacterium piscinae]|uniref:Dialkylresorcinol condensing enzyme DarA n=1 Tax=Flavobacterium piscinae TaxID=2506424 RepID=A0A4Q1KQL2_9FLAO|nr:dialkylrecorsinol condensing enzyme DarA [Flavobacterium piscinae]RXR31589.1 dialkylresorcinol condensing enzyme DarA [Flavobacterium piscinae]